jgi:hypothetical protein
MENGLLKSFILETYALLTDTVHICAVLVQYCSTSCITDVTDVTKLCQ